MSRIYRLPTEQQRLEEASHWVARMDRGLTASEMESLRRWMDASADNRRLLLELAKLWDKMDCLASLSELFPTRRRSRPARWYGALAAVLLLAVTVSLSSPVSRWLDATTATVVTSVHETRIGERSTVLLPDGSVVTLNTNSLLTVRYHPRYRLLELSRGEVFVQVARDPDRPLNVIAGGAVLQAVGTAFNVRINSSMKVELLVTEGKVLIGVDQPLADDERLRGRAQLSGAAAAVERDERAVIDGARVDVTPQAVDPEEIEVNLSWRDGNLIFRGEALEDAVAEINRYTPVEFVFLDEELRRVRVAGLFKTGDVQGLLDTLRANFNISYERIGDDKILLKSR